MKKIRTAVSIVKNEGLGKVFDILKGRLFPKKVNGFEKIKRLIGSKSGLEIGGPSWIFMDYNAIPVYKSIKSLDNCNFSSNTIWEGEIKNDKPFVFYKGKTGKQYIAEATDLSFIKDEAYEFIISSHCLEHTANPLKALKEWIRVIKKGGAILIVLPNKKITFDHKRPTTTFDHLVSDYNSNMSEKDMTHFDEVIALHDLSMDVKAGTVDQFRERSLKNYEIRAMHHHVFDIRLMVEMLKFFNVEVLLTDSEEDLVILGKK